MVKISKKMRKIASIGLLATTATTSIAPTYVLAQERSINTENNIIEVKKANQEILKMAVISDVHIFPEEFIGNEGPNYQAYVNGDRKMLKESERILDATIERLLESDVEIVLVAGDLTKDSEVEAHEIVAKQLKRLEDAGMQVFVTNGNHDINAPDAERFNALSGTVEDENRTDEVEKLQGIMQDEFEDLYKQFGFGDENTIASDPNSTSYVARLANGYRLVVMDTGTYGDSKGDQSTSGHLENGRLEWILKQVEEAKKAGDTVIGMSHHGIVEHFDGQGVVFAPYLVANYESISTQLADAGMEYVFTGHFHAQDIAVKTTDKGNTIMDIMTGSTVSYPSPIRYIEIDGSAKKIDVESERITSIDGIENFEDYSEATMRAGVPGMVSSLLSGILTDLVDSMFPSNANLSEDKKLISDYMNEIIEEEAREILESNPELLKEYIGESRIIENDEVIDNNEEIVEDDTVTEDGEISKEDTTEDEESSKDDVVVEDGETTEDEESVGDEQTKALEDMINDMIKNIFTKERLTNYINAVCKSLEDVEIDTSIGENYKLMDAVEHCLMEVYAGDEEYSDAMKTLKEELETLPLVQDALIEALTNKENLVHLHKNNFVDKLLVNGVFNSEVLGKLFDTAISEDGNTVGGVIGSAFATLLNSILSDDTPDNNAVYIDGKITTSDTVQDKVDDINNNIDRSKYSASSLAILDEALAYAKKVLSNESASQEDIENAMAGLYRAISGLEVKETGSGGGGVVVPTVQFKDIENHWAKDSILRFVNKGYIEGYGDNTFKPENAITRAEFVKIVNKLYGYSTRADIKFSDVSSNEWYYDEVRKGVQAGYIDGYEDNTFRPNQNITREEASKIIAKITGLKGDGKLNFKDVDKVSDWAKDYVDALSDNKIITGYEDNTFRPANNITRAESVIMMDRIEK